MTATRHSPSILAGILGIIRVDQEDRRPAHSPSKPIIPLPSSLGLMLSNPIDYPEEVTKAGKTRY